MSRVLGRVRLSRSHDESTSVERQREIITQWAELNEHEIIGWAEDVDVSGSVDPWETPGLGPWLTEERAGDYDIICAWKLDRLSRRAVAMHRLFGFVEEHDKTLVCVADNIDLSTWVGRLIASVIAGVAEGELEAIRERQRSSQGKLRAMGRFSGGVVPYGYVKVPHSTGAGWALDVDPIAAEEINGIVREVLAGHSLNSIARALNDRGVLPPAEYCRQRDGKPLKGQKWSQAKLSQLLSSQMLLGVPTHGRIAVRDEQGEPVPLGPPVVDEPTWLRLQEALESRRRSGTRTVAVSPVNGVAVCYQCGANLHRNKTSRPEKIYYHYRCPNKCSRSIRAEIVENLLEELVLDELGDAEVHERVFVPGENNEIAIEAAIRAVDELTPLLGATTSDRVRQRLTEQIRALDFKIASLEKQESSPARYEYIPTGETYRSRWETSSPEQKRRTLLAAGIKLRVEPDRFDFVVPDDLLDRLS